MIPKKTCMMATLALLFASALVGCSKSDPPMVTPATPLAIRLNAGMLTSKAAVNNGNTFTAAIAGWESSSAVNYGVKRKWQTTSAITASETATDVTLASEQHYSQNSAVKTYIKAWYPAGTLSDDGVVTFDGAADGTVDVLLANEVSGSALEADEKTLAFKHLLTQVKFAIQGDAAFGSTTLVKSITIKDAGVPTGIDLKVDAVSYTTTELTVPEIDGTQAITTTKTIIGQPTMIRPIPSNTFKLDVATSVTTYRDVIMTIDDEKFVPGRAYTITLTFGGAGISLGSTVDEWTAGTGSGQIVD